MPHGQWEWELHIVVSKFYTRVVRKIRNSWLNGCRLHTTTGHTITGQNVLAEVPMCHFLSMPCTF